MSNVAIPATARTDAIIVSQVLHDGKWRPVSLSNLEKAPQIELDEALTRATSRKGYRMV